MATRVSNSRVYFNFPTQRLIPRHRANQKKVKVLRAPLKTVLFRDGGVSHVLKSSCIRPYTPVFRARLPCPYKKCRVFKGALKSKLEPLLFFSIDEPFDELSHMSVWIMQHNGFAVQLPREARSVYNSWLGALII